jgi:hypothetical protein
MLNSKRLAHFLFRSLFLAGLSITTVLLSATNPVNSETSTNLFAQTQNQPLYPPKVPPKPTPNPLLKPKPQDIPTLDLNKPIYRKPLGERNSIEVKPPNVDIRTDTPSGTHRTGVCVQQNPQGFCIRYQYTPK